MVKKKTVVAYIRVYNNMKCVYVCILVDKTNVKSEDHLGIIYKKMLMKLSVWPWNFQLQTINFFGGVYICRSVNVYY